MKHSFYHLSEVEARGIIDKRPGTCYKERILINHKLYHQIDPAFILVGNEFTRGK